MHAAVVVPVRRLPDGRPGSGSHLRGPQAASHRMDSARRGHALVRGRALRHPLQKRLLSDPQALLEVSSSSTKLDDSGGNYFKPTKHSRGSRSVQTVPSRPTKRQNKIRFACESFAVTIAWNFFKRKNIKPAEEVVTLLKDMEEAVGVDSPLSRGKDYSGVSRHHKNNHH